jgi:hypothetical protein
MGRLKNYSKKISLFTLLVYVTFLSIAVFHHHTYDIGIHTIISDVVNGENNSAKDPFLDDQANCKLVQFAHSFYSNFTHNSNLLEFLPLIKNVKISITDSKFESLKTSTNQLRAPPVS